MRLLVILMKPHNWTAAEDELLIQLYYNTNSEELTQHFNKVLGTNLASRTLMMRCNKLGLRKRRRYTEEEIEWLRQNVMNYSWSNLTSAFNAHFGTNISVGSIDHICIRNGITHGRKGEHGFIEGKHNAFSVTHPIGTERTDSRGRVFIKVNDNVSKQGSAASGNWRQKSRVVWEYYHGKLSSNDLIIHLDGDKTNCNIDNLYKTTRQVNALLSTWDWNFPNKELTRTAIKCCELMVATSQPRRKEV